MTQDKQGIEPISSEETLDPTKGIVGTAKATAVQLYKDYANLESAVSGIGEKLQKALLDSIGQALTTDQIALKLLEAAKEGIDELSVNIQNTSTKYKEPMIVSGTGATIGALAYYFSDPNALPTDTAAVMNAVSASTNETKQSAETIKNTVEEAAKTLKNPVTSVKNVESTLTTASADPITAMHSVGNTAAGAMSGILVTIAAGLGMAPLVAAGLAGGGIGYATQSDNASSAAQYVLEIGEITTAIGNIKEGMTQSLLNSIENDKSIEEGLLDLRTAANNGIDALVNMLITKVNQSTNRTAATLGGAAAGAAGYYALTPDAAQTDLSTTQEVVSTMQTSVIEAPATAVSTVSSAIDTVAATAGAGASATAGGGFGAGLATVAAATGLPVTAIAAAVGAGIAGAVYGAKKGYDYFTNTEVQSPSTRKESSKIEKSPRERRQIVQRYRIKAESNQQRDQELAAKKHTEAKERMAAARDNMTRLRQNWSEERKQRNETNSTLNKLFRP